MIDEDDEEDYFKMNNIQSPSVCRRTMSFNHGVTGKKIGSPHEKQDQPQQPQQPQESQESQESQEHQPQEPQQQEHQPQQQEQQKNSGHNSPESALLKQYLLENPFAASIIRNFL
jgi:flagellar motor protein MotB